MPSLFTDDRNGFVERWIIVEELLGSTVRPKPTEPSQLVLVTYVFGSRLPASGRCISSKQELAQLSRRTTELAAYVVEVCQECAWNHLARTFLIGGRRTG